MNKDKTILICDDSITSRRKLVQAIALKGDFTIIEAADGQKAVDLYKANRPDLVFMDIIMPVKDGIEATKEIRAFDEKAQIIILSSVGTKENLKKALTNGATDFIQKPWEDASIQSILAKLI